MVGCEIGASGEARTRMPLERRSEVRLRPISDRSQSHRRAFATLDTSNSMRVAMPLVYSVTELLLPVGRPYLDLTRAAIESVATDYRPGPSSRREEMPLG